MKPFFCAIANKQAGEDLIGTASQYQTYVLIECPLPWAAKAFSSSIIPLTLRQYINQIKSEQSVQFLCIHRGQSNDFDQTTVLIYEQSVTSLGGVVDNAYQFASHYRGYEFTLSGLDAVVSFLEDYWEGQRIGRIITEQDVLICTHGMRDKCCARFGQPLFIQAKQMASSGKLSSVRPWKTSHIGGHRFAPTAITFPDGRYYGRLSPENLQAVLTRHGPVSRLKEIYRGWGLLPAPLQIAERIFFLNNGWVWLDCEVSYRLLTTATEQRPPIVVANDETSMASENTPIEAEFAIHWRNGNIRTYALRLARDLERTTCVQASCSSALPTPVTKYALLDCREIEPVVSTTNARAESSSLGK
ncbi:MAG: sucrase ferredoxin [Cyanobacteria bacterium J06627_28]